MASEGMAGCSRGHKQLEATEQLNTSAYTSYPKARKVSHLPTLHKVAIPVDRSCTIEEVCKVKITLAYCEE